MLSLKSKLSLMTFALLFAIIVPALALSQTGEEFGIAKAPCKDCHLCDNPTKAEPCLMVCPGSIKDVNAAHKVTEGPGMIVLGTTGTLYEPVNFNHTTHASMGEMGDGCVSCHHYAPTGKIPPCSECHAKPTSLGQPGLKGAYHRQCLGCHQQWSGTNDCVNCHAPTDEPTTNNTAIGSTMNSRQPITKPAKKVYDIANPNGDKVTFYHNDHVEKFGVDCVTCHQRENCGYCHDKNATQASTTTMKSAEEIHTICNDCHDKDDCNLCHGKKEKTPFQHDAAHWRLGDYHKHLECDQCHVVGQRIKTLSADCVQCHDDWSPKNFDHQVTGLKLDETHSEFDCTDCHLNNKYHQPPSCIDCHDQDRTPDKDTPGVKVGLKTSKESNKALGID
jgi:hypothetical protein